MNHCKPISKIPERAQTSNFVLLKNFTQDLAERVLSIQRSKPWGIYWPPGGGDED
ncbi:MAG TPA: hypothetical protein PLM14_05740 [Candidatus Hydrogenedentes bacterium]|nr:hypothetical protein [Candidatus Hydrogenedentota bacterium]HQE82482.1 hypothetical protein [Candidatus Hydrogenedentota bacterium]HQH50780.1 hypothetical protein [Candidatus Hydrogenedentota bacterium]HQM47718.1 hypothetical protein [Candidatus Hydrogenedentota bacterium]